MSTASRCIKSILRLAGRLLAPALALFSVSCQPVDHFIFHPRVPPPGVTIRYAEVRRGDLLVRLEWARPTGDGPFPAILVHHEFGRTAEDMQGVIYDLAKAGYLAASAGYRRFVNDRPEATPLPWRQPQDETAAFEVFLANPDVDREHVGLLGFSMGAFQSLWIASRMGGAVKSVVAYYPVTDFAQWLDTTHGKNDWEIFMRRQIREYFKREAGAKSEKEFEDYIINFSIVKHVAGLTAPVLLIHGDRDPTVSIEQSRLLKAKLDDLGRHAELLEIPGAVHVFNFKDAAQAATAWRATVDWFRKTLQP
jgi:dienelactone hydrolase